MILTGRVWFLLLICLQCNIFKFHDERSAFAFAQNITTNGDSFCSQGITLVLCQILPKQIFMEKCITNGEFDSSTLWKGNTIGLHVPQAVFFTLTNEKGIYHGGELNLREFYRFQLTVASNLNEVYEINYRDLVIFFCFNLPWTCMFILLLKFKLFGKAQWTTLQYTRYRGHIWSRRKVY